jgi:hypothetical protein
MAITPGHSIGLVSTRPSRKKCLRAIAQRSASQTEAIAVDSQTAGIVIHSLGVVRLLKGWAELIAQLTISTDFIDNLP